MHPAGKATLSFVLFFVAVIGFTFMSTFLHEMSHAAAWGDAPEIRFYDDRPTAEEALTVETTHHIDGNQYRVKEVHTTTIALYPMNILAAGATLGLAPAAMLDDPILGSTFYALEDEHYHTLAAGGHVTEWQHSAMPMIVNGLLSIPILVWLFLRPGSLSMAAAWVNAAEWRFNTHHAQEIGIPGGVYLAISVLIMLSVATLVSYLAARRFSTQSAWPQPEQNAASSESR